MDKKAKTIPALCVLMIALFLFSSPSEAQRNVTYEELAQKSRQQPMFFDFFSLPGNPDSTITFVSAFSISYNYLPFKKINNAGENRQFFSTARLDMEVFRSDPSRIGEKDVSVEGLESVRRSSWRDTAYAESYGQTSEADRYLAGNLSVKLPPGVYSYALQLNRGDRKEDRLSRTRTVRLRSYEEKKYGDILPVSSISDQQSPETLRLLNLGDRIVYGEDFHAFAHIPRFDRNSSYALVVERVTVSDRDTSAIDEVYRQELGGDQILTGITPVLDNSVPAGTEITLRSASEGGTYALVQVPNRKFPNASYHIKIMKEGSKEPSAVKTVHSIWFDMPSSLLNLDVAIDMLRFIADRSTIRDIKSGSRSEREKKFREFWQKKDPTPDTQFNELMAEYYRRIDYAYENFSTMNSVGYDSDQGEIYIKFGPPKNVERKFPREGTTTEVWSYESREFVFRATSGFGDFKLVSES